MKKIILAAVLAIMALAVSAAPPKHHVTKTIHCAVLTKNVVNIAMATKAKHYADYNGRRYFFCCGNCPKAFKANPKKYAKHDSIPIPKHHHA